MEEAIDESVPMPAITAALFARFASRQDDSPAMKVVAALRNQFGGHAVESLGGDDAKAPDNTGAQESQTAQAGPSSGSGATSAPAS